VNCSNTLLSISKKNEFILYDYQTLKEGIARKTKKVKKRFAFLIFFYKLVRVIYKSDTGRMSKEEKIEVE